MDATKNRSQGQVKMAHNVERIRIEGADVLQAKFTYILTCSKIYRRHFFLSLHILYRKQIKAISLK